MRILQITAGAANMYCGSCMRDNALAAELKVLGHDLTLLPVYTPTLTDEENVSEDKVFFGGISVYLKQNYALFRLLPRFVDKLWDSPAAIKAALKRSISVDPRFLGEMTVSMLQGVDGNLKSEYDKLTDYLRSQAAPDIVSIPYTLLIGLAEPLQKATKAKIVCGLQGEDLFLDALIEPYRTQALNLIRKQLTHVDAFISVSDYYTGFMRSYLGIPQTKLHTVPLGISTMDFTPVTLNLKPPYRIGYFARVAPEKGLHNLVDAFTILKDRLPCTLEAAGYLPPEHTAYLEQQVSRGLVYRGSMNRAEKARFIQSLDVFSVPTDYHEPKGLFLLEAMACGIPVVQPSHGAFSELVETTEAGILYAPGSAQALAQALERVLTSPHEASVWGSNGARSVREKYTLRAMASRTASVFSSVI